MKTYKFSFRGLDVFVFNTENKTITSGLVGGIPAFNLCGFIQEDYSLLSVYFANIHRFMEGEIAADELKNIEVF